MSEGNGEEGIGIVELGRKIYFKAILITRVRLQPSYTGCLPGAFLLESTESKRAGDIIDAIHGSVAYTQYVRSSIRLVLEQSKIWEVYITSVSDGHAG
ncbi:hypothetical protein WG66_013405, partial [Moniliophthora roreri]